MKTSRKSVLTNLALLFATVVFCFVVLEVAFRLLTPKPIFHENLLLRPNLIREYSVNLSGVTPTIKHTTNRYGFRGDPLPAKVDGRHLIMTIGGSTTQCVYLDDRKTWPYQLQEKLKGQGRTTTVQNAGLDGHSTRAHLLMMREVVPLIKPDAVIFLVGVNDLGLSLNPAEYLEGNSFERTSVSYKLFAKSRLLQAVWTWKQILSGEVLLASVGHQNIELTAMRGKEAEYSRGFEDELISLHEYERNLREIISIGKEQGIEMLFMTQPLLYGEDEYWAGIQAQSAWIDIQNFSLSARTFAQMLGIFNERLLEICRETGVECFDLAAEIPHSQEYFYDDIHFNEKGATLVADSIAAYLVADSSEKRVQFQ